MNRTKAPLPFSSSSGPRGCDRPCAGAVSLRRHRADYILDARDRVGREARSLCVLANDVFARRAIDAVDLVVSDVAVHPLDVGSELAQDGAGNLGRYLQFVGAEGADTRHVSLDDEFGHARSPSDSTGAKDRWFAAGPVLV